MIRLLVLGERGMLGSAVVREAALCSHDVFGGHVDATNAWALHRVKREFRPDAVINCAGIIPLKKRSPVVMAEVNAVAPHQIADVFDEQYVVHVSTDCVFSGVSPEPYTIADTPDPVDLYGRTKRAGELIGNPNAVTVRTSFVGLNHGLLPWFLNSGFDEVPGWTNALWSGSTDKAVARGLVQIASGHRTGVLHLAAPSITKYQALVSIKEAFGVETKITPCDVPFVARNLEPSIELPPFAQAVRELVR